MQPLTATSRSLLSNLLQLSVIHGYVRLGVCLMLLVLWCNIQLLYANLCCLQVAHLYQ